MTKFNKDEQKAYDFLLKNKDIGQHIKTYMPKESLDKLMNL